MRLHQFSFVLGLRLIRVDFLKPNRRPDQSAGHGKTDPNQQVPHAETTGGAKKAHPRRWLFRLLSLTVIPLILLGTVEFGLRLAGSGYPTSFFLRSNIGDRNVLVENSQFGLRFFPRQMLRRPPPLVVESPKPENTYRIFVFGESAAMGDPDPSFSFSRILEVLLADRFPGASFEVINTAFTAINSHVILPIARECGRQQGDLWIVYMGNNEVAGPFGPATVFGAPARSLALIRSGLALKAYKIGQLLESLRAGALARSGSAPEWGGLQMFLKNQIPMADPSLDLVRESLQRNLEDILNLGRAAGAEVIVSSVACNLRDCPPFASAHSPALDTTTLSAWDALYLQGTGHETAGRAPEALRAFEEAAALDATHAELQFRMGRLLLATGRQAEARTAFERSRDLDTLRFRTDSRLNQVIAGTTQAAAGPKVRYVDAARLIQESAPDGISGSESFFDHVHLTFKGNYRLARVFAEEVLNVLPQTIRQRDSNQWSSEQQCAARLALTGWNRIQLLESMSQRLSEAPFTNQLNHVARQQQFREELNALQPSLQPVALDEAVQTYRSALNLRPGDFQLHRNFANFLHARNQTSEAVAQARKVVEQLPHNPESHYNLGFLLTAAGMPTEAETQFRESIRINPDQSAAYTGLGKALAGLGRETEALESFEQAIARNPSDAEALLSLSQLWQKSGNLSKARETIVKALQARPRSFAIQIQMGTLLVQEGDLLSAARHFSESVRLQPEAGLRHFAAPVQESPRDARAHFFLANAMAASNQRAQSLELLHKTVELDPEFWEARYFLGVELATGNRVGEAGQQFAEVVRLKPGFALGHLNLGVALARDRQWNQARREFEETLRLDPGNPQATRYLDTLKQMLQ
jgi:tetratricopeptide (TPR) repeat protein